MSRHFFDCELRWLVRVRLGYNPPRNELFLEVERIGVDPGQRRPTLLYTSFRDLFDGGGDLDYYRQRLEQLGLVVPDSMFQAVEEDASRGVGDRCAQHFADGRIVEPAAD